MTPDKRPSLYLRDFVPPIAASAARLIWGSRSGPTTYRTFAEASAACRGYGYEEATLLRCLRLKAEAYREACKTEPPQLAVGELMLLGALSAGSGAFRTVIDHGGGAGRHFFGMRSVMRVPLRWDVVETPGLAAECKPLEGDGLTFSDRLEGVADVVFSSGALQCVPDPAATLAELCALGAQRMVLARIGVAPAPVAVVHRGRLSEHGGPGLPPGIPDHEARIPLMFVTRAALEAVWTAAGYRVVATAADASGIEPGLGMEGFSVLLEKR